MITDLVHLCLFYKQLWSQLLDNLSPISFKCAHANTMKNRKMKLCHIIPFNCIFFSLFNNLSFWIVTFKIHHITICQLYIPLNLLAILNLKLFYLKCPNFLYSEKRLDNKQNTQTQVLSRLLPNCWCINKGFIVLY